ncbi:hypothetical protein JW992_12320 [candidate division KSB1 bacterium]|nr:hypothetical protein [candidate division KSB1 bacterium]
MHFSPSVYEHAARFVSESPYQVSRSVDLMVQAHATAYRRYHHQPITVGIDIYNLEAEAYGAVVAEPTQNDIPTISRPICQELQDLLDLKPFDPLQSGRLPLVLQAGKELIKLFPEADVRIPVSGPFSIASNLLGMENLLLGLAFFPELAQQALSYLVDNQILFSRAILESRLKITFFESAATPPLVSPTQFRQVLLPVLHLMNKRIVEISGEPIALVIGGDTCSILDDLIGIGSTYLICPSETDQTSFMKKLESHPEIMVRINMDPRVVSYGTPTEIGDEIDRIFGIAEDRDKVCLGTGVLAYDTPPENIELIQVHTNRKSQGA